MDAQASIAVVSAIIAGLSAIISWTAMRQTWKISQVAHIFTLRAEWDKFPGINWKDPYANEDAVIQACNLLEMMARLWKFKVIARKILYETYWNSFKELYEGLSALTTQDISSHKKTPHQLLDDDDIEDAYNAMKKYGKRKWLFRFL